MEFTFNEFEGYKFNCETVGANVGFKHVCEVVKDYETVLVTSIHYGNRTWEEYRYKHVLEKAKNLLQDKLSNNVKPEIDTDFLCKLVEMEYIRDYAVMSGSDDIYILMNGWYQVEGNKRYNKDTNEWELESESVYSKLIKLAKQGLLKDSITYTLLNTDYVFSDEYMICDDCGKLYNCYYGEIKWVESAGMGGMMLCEDCIPNNEDAICGMIEDAVGDFKKAVDVCISEDILNEHGYTKLIDDLSSSYHMWGEKRFGYDYIDMDRAENICNEFGGFAKLESVQQFDTIFSIYVPDDCLESAKRELILN